MQLDNLNDILTIDEVCEILKIGKSQCYTLLRSKQLKGFQIGKTWKIPQAAISQFIHNKLK